MSTINLMFKRLARVLTDSRLHFTELNRLDALELAADALNSDNSENISQITWKVWVL